MKKLQKIMEMFNKLTIYRDNELIFQLKIKINDHWHATFISLHIVAWPDYYLYCVLYFRKKLNGWLYCVYILFLIILKLKSS